MTTVSKVLGMVIVVWGLTGCAGILNRPAVDQVQSMAIVSLYANHDIYDVKSKQNASEHVNVLKKLVGIEDDMAQDARKQVVTYALGAFTNELNGVRQWRMIQPAAVIQNARYQRSWHIQGEGAWGGALKAAGRVATARWIRPPGMAYIPYERVVSDANVRAKLAQLCQDLRVDAVAVVAVDLAFKRTLLSGMSGTGVFSGVLGKAKPSVSAAMVAVDKHGTIVVKTPAIARGGGDRSVGQSAPMLKRGVVYLQDRKGQAVHAYNQTLTASAAGMRQTIAKAFAKK